MSADKSRLYYGPLHTVETLKAVISGSKTRDQIADDLNVSSQTVYNKLHDPLHLGLIEKKENSYEPSDGARKLIQLQDKEVLRKDFVNLPGVEKIQNQLEAGGLSHEEVGRIISFETKSGAADENTFERYGQVYAHWFEYLDLGQIGDGKKRSKNPLKNNRGASYPQVPPQKVIDSLRVADDVDTHEELADNMDVSKVDAQKTLSTAYGLGVAHRERGGSFSTTEIGRTVTTTTEGKQRELLRKNLLDVPFVQAYCNRVPSGEFKNKEVVEKVVNDYNLGWSDVTISTRSKRLYQWLIFTDLAEEETTGVLKATSTMLRGNLPEP